MTRPVYRSRRQSSIRRELLTHTPEAFLTISNHELKSPLTAIRVNSQLGIKYLHRNMLPQVEEALQIIETQSFRMEQLLKDLLDASKLSNGIIHMHPHQCDIAALCRQMIKMQETIHDGRNIIALIPPEPVIIMADPNRLTQVMTNLIINALKYSPANTPITVSLHIITYRKQPAVVFSVCNEGKGIPVDELPVIFEQFYRASNEVEGLGLGLYLCAKIIEQHHGEIWVESEVEAGSTFSICLPIHTTTS